MKAKVVFQNDFTAERHPLMAYVWLKDGDDVSTMAMKMYDTVFHENLEHGGQQWVDAGWLALALEAMAGTIRRKIKSVNEKTPKAA